MQIKRFCKSTALLLLFVPFLVYTQPRWDGARIQHELLKLNTVGNALYLAAHPDDENTRIITWLANEKKVRTAYLSLTRGDGGQNLIGDEKGALMGLIRTQELREARKLDGGEQFFTRALDFGYSKTPDETFEKWNRDSVLADVVMTIRKFKPDVIVLRFPPNSRAGHGHHSASAILAEEAFNLTSDASKFPESASKYGTWQAKRIYFNDSPWWDRDIEDRKDEYVTVDVGAYNPLLGRSYTEIAGMSRSQHSSQGFGASLFKGQQIEYLKVRDGEPATQDVFEGIDISWSRVDGGKKIGKSIDEIITNYNPAKPDASLEKLVALYNTMLELPDNSYKAYKVNQLKEIIAACGGFWYELLAEQPLITQGDSFTVTVEALTQLSNEITLTNITIDNQKMEVNTPLTSSMLQKEIPHGGLEEITNPYWLSGPSVQNMFTIEEKELLGLPQNPAWLSSSVSIQLFDTEITYTAPLRYKWVDRAQGELYREVQIAPSVQGTPDAKTLVFTSSATKTLTLKVEAGDESISDLIIKPQVPAGWKVTPSKVNVETLDANGVKYLTFQIEPSATQESTALTFNYTSSIRNGDLRQVVEIDYPHIETQVVMPKTTVQLVSAPAKIVGSKVGYIVGAGDEVPEALRQLGYTVETIDPERATGADLADMDAVVVGIRAYNKVEAMQTFSAVLNGYVKQGGTVVVQYNTNRGMQTKEIGPYPVTLSRGRVTVEEAPATWLKPSHPIFNTPNKLTEADFEDWVQERGLYFASEFDDRYIPLISWSDPGEEPLNGGLLATTYGEGTYVFTGISFFRQLPAGVPGAFRLFANIVSFKQTNLDGPQR